MDFKIGNIRLGHATNSSSSHSIVIIPNEIGAPKGYASEYGEYNWEEFVLSETEDKLAYLATAVGNSINHMYGEQIAGAVMRELFPTIEWEKDWYIDHQSCPYIPKDARTGQVCFDLINDFKDFVSRSDVCILGGNDNNGSERFDNYKKYVFEYPLIDTYGSHIRASKSEAWWSLYNVETGAKVRFSFEDSPQELLRSSSPELVDIKITDYCPFGCAYCYQNSTINGAHASLKDIEEYFNAMQKSGVFEMAIGGGEPLLHPDFPAILKLARKCNITPNFTTHILPDKWSEEVVRAVREYAGAFAVSIREVYDVHLLHAAAFMLGFRNRVVAHYVVGAHSDFCLGGIVSACKEKHIPLTLLGYKETGRGKTYPQQKQHVTPELLKSAWRLSVDTSFVEKYANILKEAAIPDVLVVPGEGRFSMYIDAVNGKAGVSSYHTDTFQDFEVSYWNGLDDIWNKLHA